MKRLVYAPEFERDIMVFGPNPDSHRCVEDLVEVLSHSCGQTEERWKLEPFSLLAVKSKFRGEDCVLHVVIVETQFEIELVRLVPTFCINLAVS
jgi:hypothetical protein